MDIPPSAPPEESGSLPVTTPNDEAKEAPRAFLGSARRNLSEDEAASPAGRRWLIAEVERLDSECAKLKTLSEERTDLLVKLAKLEESQKHSKWLDVLSFVTLSVGSAGLGAAPSYMTAKGLESVGWVFVIGSSILVLVGILSRVMK